MAKAWKLAISYEALGLIRCRLSGHQGHQKRDGLYKPHLLIVHYRVVQSLVCKLGLGKLLSVAFEANRRLYIFSLAFDLFALIKRRILLNRNETS